MMSDAMTSERGSIVDRLGRHGRIEAIARSHLLSMGHSCCAPPRPGSGSAGLRIAVPLAPRVELREEAAGDRQRISLVMTAPLVGRVYEYSGEFDYAIVPS